MCICLLHVRAGCGLMFNSMDCPLFLDYLLVGDAILVGTRHRLMSYLITSWPSVALVWLAFARGHLFARVCFRRTNLELLGINTFTDNPVIQDNRLHNKPTSEIYKMMCNT